jgi:hypothetical protein
MRIGMGSKSRQADTKSVDVFCTEFLYTNLSLEWGEESQTVFFCTENVFIVTIKRRHATKRVPLDACIAPAILVNILAAMLSRST